MPKIRDTTRPQHDADGAHYGAITIEMFPDGTVPGQMPYWDGVQWRLVTLLGEAGIDISLDTVNDTLTFIHADNRVYEFYTGDAIILKTVSGTFTGDAVLV